MDAAQIARRRAEALFGPAEAPPGFVMRPATEDDLKGIQKLTHNMMEGLDFLASSFLRYMQDPNRYVYVATEDGEVIASCTVYVVDGGRTLYIAGCRVQADYEGMSLAKALHNTAVTQGLTNWPNVQKYRYVAALNAHMYKEAAPRGVRVLDRKPFVTLAKSVTSRDVAGVLSPAFTAVMAELSVDTSQVRAATIDDFRRIFGDKALAERVFPKEYISAGMEIFEPCTENLSAMISEDREYTISMDGLSVCCGQIWQAQLGCFYLLMLHGEASAETAMAHFLGLVQFALKQCPAGIPMNVVYSIPENIPKEKFVALCEKLPFYRSEDTVFEGSLVFEKVLPQIVPSQL